MPSDTLRRPTKRATALRRLLAQASAADADPKAVAWLRALLTKGERVVLDRPAAEEVAK